LGVVLRVPLNAERKARSAGNSDRLDGAVFRHALNNNTLARLENSLTMKRVHSDSLLAEEPCEGATRDEADLMTVGEDNRVVRMDFTRFQSRHPMVHAPGNSRISGCSEPPNATFIS